MKFLTDRFARWKKVVLVVQADPDKFRKKAAGDLTAAFLFNINFTFVRFNHIPKSKACNM